MQGECLSGPWIKSSSSAWLRISLSVFSLPWIIVIAIRGGARPTGLGFYPFCMKFMPRNLAISTLPKLMELY
jgi:hypothetical protein